MLDGVMPSDLGLVSDVELDGSLADLTEDEIKEIQEIYKKYISAKLSQLDNHIKEDENLAKKYNELKFTEKVIGGKILVVDESQEKGTKAARMAKNAENKQYAKAATKKFVSGRR